MSLGSSIIESVGTMIGTGFKLQGERRKEEALRKGSEAADKISTSYADKQAGFYDPYAKAGNDAVGDYAVAAREPVQPFAFRDSSTYLNDYFNSPEYQTLNAQAQDQILRGSSATGGLRSGAANVGLAKIAPTIGIDALNRVNQQDLQTYNVNRQAANDRFARLGDVSRMGFQASGDQAGTYGGLGTNLANSQMFRANARANKFVNYGNINAQNSEDQAAIWGNYVGGMGGSAGGGGKG